MLFCQLFTLLPPFYNSHRTSVLLYIWCFKSNWIAYSYRSSVKAVRFSTTQHMFPKSIQGLLYRRADTLFWYALVPFYCKLTWALHMGLSNAVDQIPGLLMTEESWDFQTTSMLWYVSALLRGLRGRDYAAKIYNFERHMYRELHLNSKGASVRWWTGGKSRLAFISAVSQQ